MIYDPIRRALELRQRILESMSSEELADYVLSNANMSDGAAPVVIRRCDKCGQDRTLEPRRVGGPDCARCGCGILPLDAYDLESLEGRHP
jgi:hypothetical protein